MKYQYNDGGRTAAGWKSLAGDCATRAVAIVTGKPYMEVYNEIVAASLSERVSAKRKGRGERRSHPRSGVYAATMQRYLKGLGFAWTPTMTIGGGCKVHLRSEELPTGRLICRVSKHFVAVIDGVIHDTHDCSREGNRCVYGYWTLSNPIKAEVI